MRKAIVLTAALFAASSAYAAETGSQGASKNAPGQQMQNSKTSTAPGASEYAPGHQTNTTAGPGHSESAPGQRSTTTGSSTTKK
ncbi:conserved exported hypothetical protein [Bradyrhizobium sp. ORS 375]|uniref:hypothetical protein n=1 Tax=Bradyrhizobium sp. (strain ORS 375) TaxID=566679 RepID=UPI000240587C|nr:hypothetical protein [Bradyrhizobium sp. ORS 375]CCD94174.1 conserved exported hypothetical protein [Bradyrhizobium sp. ORS 375]